MFNGTKMFELKLTIRVYFSYFYDALNRKGMAHICQMMRAWLFIVQSPKLHQSDC